MVLRLPSFKSKLGNLIIKDHVIRYVELKQTDPLIIGKQQERYLPSGLIENGQILDRQGLLFILEECVQEWGIKRSNVRIVLPDHLVILRPQTLPEKLEEDEIRSYLFMEIGSTIHLPFEDAIFDYVISSQHDEEVDIILFAAPEKLVVSYVDLLQEVTLTASVADLSSLSTYRLCFYRDLVRPTDHYLLLQVDLLSMNVSIFTKHHPVFMRHLALPSTHGAWEMSTYKDGETGLVFKGEKDDLLTEMTAITNEVERIMNFYQYSMNQGNETITKVLVTGDHPYIHDIVQTMDQQLSIPFEFIDVSSRHDEGLLNLSSRYHVAVGLALKEVT
ncbi:type IV pilus biogenesis protein PilM [Metabacillus iocasae]|uniref:Type IV pilus assembly protein PilM n=1 Tax=Priestia iocasae TaxID=2291674 RepID=A0ABS2QQ67_9BACI|nr:pilus assembly protein PilM [Metabacillus iocasae]MBM7701358.1 type IV pilus assembly protein PilM [Metabacillus iocasae]